MVISGLKDLKINGTPFIIKGDLEVRIDNLKNDDVDNVSGASLEKTVGSKGGSIQGSSVFVQGEFAEFVKLVRGDNLLVELIYTRGGARYKYVLTNATFREEITMTTEDSSVAINFRGANPATETKL